MRNISFSMTTQAFRERRKTVTRRLGWWNLKPGDVLMGVEKGMGLKKGEHVVRLGAIRVVGVQKQTLNMITPEDVAREGFSGMGCEEFMTRFIAHNRDKCLENGPYTIINRIEFEYLLEGKT